MKLYVDLIDEGTSVRYPVQATHISGNVYQITEVNPEPDDMHWSFNTGDKVKCRYEVASDGERILVAYERATS